MPELPDIEVYIESLATRIVNRRIDHIDVKNPFLLRTAEPPLGECVGRSIRSLRRVGKRIALELDGDFWLVIHLMIAGRLHWYEANHRGKMRPALLYIRFPNGTLTLTEAGTKRRASMHVVRGEEGLASHDRGGLEVLDSDLNAFIERMRRRNHTLKRALTDPTILSGIGNAYSDEILFAAKLSPIAQTSKLELDDWRRLFDAIHNVLSSWTDRLRTETGDAFPESVTAFRDAMNVHGKFGRPCPACGSPVQRIRYADNETNYCARCQTGGRLLADRAFSRLLKDDWPKTIDAMENRQSSDHRARDDHAAGKLK